MDRRLFFRSLATQLGAVALADRLARDGFAGTMKTHHPAKAKSIIFLYMDGGPSQVDTFDPKPALTKYAGKNPSDVMKVEPTQFNNVGRVLPSPWKFKQHGQSGAWVSELFPHVAGVADELAFLKGMTSQFSEHTSANYFMHTGSGLQGRPSWGAWAGYGLGVGKRDTPDYIVLNGGLIPPGGLDNFGPGFLPAAYQASVFRAGDSPVANLKPLEKTAERQAAKLKLIYDLDTMNGPRPDAIDAAIRNYETAARMQVAVPELMDVKAETEATRELYGLNSKFAQTKTFGTQCLIARRLIERGTRFIELTCPSVGHDRWDQHSNLKAGHEANARAVDQPIAGLIKDLKARGMLDDTLIVWGGEFGRTPFAQGSDGRDHNPYGFTMWLAGGGAKAGSCYGATDEFGYRAVEGKAEVHDLHATMLYLLGFDHTKLTFRFGGRDMRLTDVHGEVLKPVLG